MGFNTRLLTSFAKLVEFQKSITVRASLNVFFFILQSEDMFMDTHKEKETSMKL